MNFIARGIAHLKFFAKDKAPALYFAAGVAGLVATGVSVWRAKPKCEEVLETYKKNVAKVEEAKKKNADYAADTKQQKIDLLKYRVQCGIGLVREFAPPLLFGIGTIGYFGASVGTALNWYKGAAIALAGSEKHVRQLEQAVIAKYGAGALNELMGGKPEATVIDMDENGETVSITKDAVLPQVNKPTQRFFGKCYTDASDGTPDGNRTFLDGKQRMWNSCLSSRVSRTSPGCVLLNEVLESLGYEKTEEGQILGWVVYPNDADNKRYGGDGYISFGFSDIRTEATRRFMLGAEECVLLTFNVDPVPVIGRDLGCGLDRR